MLHAIALLLAITSAYEVEPHLPLPHPTQPDLLLREALAAPLLLVSQRLASSHPVLAADLAMRAALLLPQLTETLHLHAASLAMQRSPPSPHLLSQLERADLLSSPSLTMPLARAQLAIALDHPQRAALVRTTLERERAASCPYLLSWFAPQAEALASARAPEADLLDIASALHAHCQEHEERASLPDSLKLPLRAEDRLERADLLISHVHFYATLAELGRVELGALSEAQQCRATFIEAQATFRIIKLRRGADALYQRVVDTCSSPDDGIWRTRSLYALGKRAFDLGSLGDAAAHFATLLADYPDRSHADDAILYLARIARAQGDSEREQVLLQRALRDYPTGDMVHELIWEVHEPLLRAGQDRAFVDALDALTLPEDDDQYFSQGRLDYLAGQALLRLKEPKAAVERWQRVWQSVPFSFYGYLAWIALRRARVPRTTLAIPRAHADDATWLFEGDWANSPAATLARVGMFELAAHVEAQRVNPTRDTRAMWRLAWLTHRAGRYPVSHNIARRRIPGSPWPGPDAGRTVRWTVAWPAPFLALIEEAVEAERAQRDDDARLEVAFPMAIMREESSFIPEIVSYAGALGLMQLMLPTARDHDRDISPRPVTREQLKTAEVNVRVGVDHLFTLAARKGSHPVLMATSYNAGSGAVSTWSRSPASRDIALWVEDIPTLQARDYTKRVIGSYLAYQWLLGVEEFDVVVGADL